MYLNSNRSFPQVRRTCSTRECRRLRWAGTHRCLAHVIAHLEDNLPVEAKGRLRDLLCTLPFRDREILKLAGGLGDGYGYSNKEIGQIFKIPAGAVRRIEHIMRRKFVHPVRLQVLGDLIDSWRLHDASNDLARVLTFCNRDRDG